MASFSGLGIGLSFVFGCILLGLVAELYYLLWWKKKISNREIDDHFPSYGTEISYLFCWKKPNSTSSNSSTQELSASVRNTEINGHEHVHDLELGGNEKDVLPFKTFDDESVESELMRLHNLCGPPRFLFTIKEETKEDLESDDGKSRGDRSRKGSRTRSLSDIIIAVDTPFLTPLASPPLKPQPLDAYSSLGFNPLFESITDADLNRLRSSPPPKFKFLRDAEEKLIRRLVEEAEKRALKNGASVQDSVIKASPNANGNGTVITEENDASFIARIAKSKERELNQQQPPPPPLCHSTPSQILPLPSSPSTFRLLHTKSGMQ